MKLFTQKKKRINLYEQAKNVLQNSSSIYLTGKTVFFDWMIIITIFFLVVIGGFFSSFLTYTKSANTSVFDSLSVKFVPRDDPSLNVDQKAHDDIKKYFAKKQETYNRLFLGGKTGTTTQTANIATTPPIPPAPTPPSAPTLPVPGAATTTGQ